MLPQDRNLHDKVFGGISLRVVSLFGRFYSLTHCKPCEYSVLSRLVAQFLTCNELCFTNAAIFSSKPLRFLSLGQITFRLPEPLGAVLRLSSKVVHTTQPHEGPHGQMVRAEVEEIGAGVDGTRHTL
jgi:acyl-coenzyme A thioesterase 9